MTQRPRARGVEHRIEIDAPADTVWRIATDVAHWAEWNPLYTAGSGRAELGETLNMTVQLAGMKPQPASGKVVTAQPGRLLEYGMSNMGGLVRAFRYIEIEPLGAGRCALRNGEILTGLVGRLLARLVGEKVRQGLQGMNEALKVRAEAGL